ncbi:MAG: hypothetical protein RIR62_1762, partial [Pseudomonadota bacterium]
VYREGQRDANRMAEFMVERGVDAGFALDVVTLGIGTMWYPSRAEMQAAGVLTPDVPQDG